MRGQYKLLKKLAVFTYELPDKPDLFISQMPPGTLLPSHHYVCANEGRRSALRFNLPACTMALTAKTQV